MGAIENRCNNNHMGPVQVPIARAPHQRLGKSCNLRFADTHIRELRISGRRLIKALKEHHHSWQI